MYGYARNQSGETSVQARVSVLYDVLNKFVFDGSLTPRTSNERELALQQLKQTRKRDLKVVKSFIASKKKTQTVKILLGRKLFKKERGVVDITPIAIRLVRIEISSGEIEVLATSLLDVKRIQIKNLRLFTSKNGP